MGSIAIPDKMYFKIGEVSAIAGVEPYVIRYWESEFRRIRPVRTKSRHRLYKKEDVNLILKIKKLLYQDGYTIAGAKKELEHLNAVKNGSLPSAEELIEFIGELKKELNEIKEILEYL
ncbi:MAG: MerR family transcriptional regulator [Thermodesulfobacteriota bacterium]|nr:MerR family transcriptional regulator [Thermodesulfobacteriota bacterium]